MHFLTFVRLETIRQCDPGLPCQAGRPTLSLGLSLALPGPSSQAGVPTFGPISLFIFLRDFIYLFETEKEHE